MAGLLQFAKARPKMTGALRMLRAIKTWARTLKRDVHALYLAGRDRRTPWYAKLFALAIAAYALSPIDLIPDFIPVLGYLDEVILLPLAILLAVRMVPPEVMAEHRATALRAEGRPVSRMAAAFIVVAWMLGAGGLLWWLWPLFQGSSTAGLDRAR
jgi:uncharacterized membrane protein YkvA (DUF1232 family)